MWSNLTARFNLLAKKFWKVQAKSATKKAMEKAEGEYRKYQVKTLSSVEKAYIETLKELKKIEKKSTR